MIMKMNNIPTMEYHILNFFRIKNDFATTVEMNTDLTQNGLPIAGPEFQKMLDNNYLDINRSNGKYTYKINETGLARFARLKKEYEHQANFLLFIDQSDGLAKNPAQSKTKHVWEWIMSNPMSAAVIGGVIALVIGTFILKLLHLL